VLSVIPDDERKLVRDSARSVSPDLGAFLDRFGKRIWFLDKIEPRPRGQRPPCVMAARISSGCRAIKKFDLYLSLMNSVCLHDQKSAAKF
jgi:hypothetical protein